MTDLVDSSQIESLVKAKRHATEHIGRASSEDLKVYILHPHACLESGIDLRECLYSLALDRGVCFLPDTTTFLGILDGDLVQVEGGRPF